MPVKVSIKNLHMEYYLKDRRVHALQDINLDIQDGEFVCVVGLSGCGKTTLLNILAGFLNHTAGSILLDGNPISAAGRMNRGVVFQEYALFPWRTALRNVEFGLEMKGPQQRGTHEEGAGVSRTRSPREVHPSVSPQPLGRHETARRRGEGVRL